MVKFVAPFYEPMPDYMRKLTLMGARFVEGNTGEGAEGDKPGDSDNPTGEAGDPGDNNPLGEKGLKALQAERYAREKAEKDLKAAQKKIADLEAQPNSGPDPDPSDSQSGESGPDDAGDSGDSAEQSLEIARLSALIDHPVPKEYRHLVKGDTKEDIEASAKAISELAKRPGVVHESGTGGDTKPGSISEHRAQIRARKKK